MQQTSERLLEIGRRILTTTNSSDLFVSETFMHKNLSGHDNLVGKLCYIFLFIINLFLISCYLISYKLMN